MRPLAAFFSRLQTPDSHLRAPDSLLPIFLLLACVYVARADSDLADPEVAVEAGRDALGSQWQAPWYDREADDLRPLNLPPPRKPSKFWANLWDWFDGVFSGWDLDLGNVLRFIGWLLLAALVVWIIIALVRAFRDAELNSLTDETNLKNDTDHIERVEALPIAIDKPLANLLEEARRRYQSGDLSGAVVYLFSHQLIELDRCELIRLVKGKTNRQYLRELRRNAASRPRLAEILQSTMELFEAAFFGAHPPSPAHFEQCWRPIEEFQALLVPTAEEAA